MTSPKPSVGKSFDPNNPKPWPLPRWDIAIDTIPQIRYQLQRLRTFSEFIGVTGSKDNRRLVNTFIDLTRYLLELCDRLCEAYRSGDPLTPDPKQLAIQEVLRQLSLINTDPEAIEDIQLALEDLIAGRP